MIAPTKRRFSIKKPDYVRWFGNPQSPLDVIKPRPWWEVMVGMGFFIIFILALTSEIWNEFFSNPETNGHIIGNVISRVALSLILILLIWGVTRKFPDWSLPYLGFVVSLLSSLIFLFIFRDQPTLIFGILSFIPPTIAILLTRWIKPFRHLWENIWQDPTRLGLVYLGGMASVCTFLIDAFPDKGKLVSSSVALLIPPTVLYMRSSRLWQRILIPPTGFLVVWIFCIFFSSGTFNQLQAISWENGLDVLVGLGLPTLVWFLLPGLWILLRRVK